MKSDKNNLPSLVNASLYDVIKSFDSFEPFQHFNDLFNQDAFSVELYETATDVVIEAKLPGCKRDQIQVEILQNDRLRIRIENSETEEAKNDENMHYYKKQAFNKMEKLITLPVPISKDAPKATYQDGLLRIVLQKGKRRFVEIG
jgi:HSP20 family protein